MKYPLIALSLLLTPLHAQRHIIRAGTLLDGRGNVAVNQTIRIDSDRITSISTSNEKPDLDLSADTVMPGWIGACLAISDSDAVMEAESKAFQLLKSGFTTVMAPSIRLRDQIDNQQWAGPRILPRGDCASADRLFEQARHQTPLSEKELSAVTSGAAERLGIAGKTGVLAPGFLADLVATHGNPLVDGAALRAVVCVMKDGHLYREPDKPERLRLILRQ